MARTYRQKNRKKGRTCRKGCIIKPGDFYLWAKPRYGGKVIGCLKHPPRPSELTTSGNLSRVYAAQEVLEDAEDLDSLRTSIDEAIANLEDARDGYQESFDNIPENFQEGDIAQGIQEKIEAIESLTSELEEIQSELDSMFEDFKSRATELDFSVF